MPRVSSRTPKPYLIRDAAQVRALASPARQEIVDALQAAGPRTISGLAALLGRPADGLYFHVRALMKVGLVVERDARKEGRHVSAVYDLVARPVTLTYDAPVRGADVVRVVRGAVRMSLREFERGVHAGTGVTSGPARTLWGGRAKGWLTAAELREVNRLVARVNSLLQHGTPRKGATCMGVGFIVAPAGAVEIGAGAKQKDQVDEGDAP